VAGHSFPTDRIVRYVLERRCREGGFCFYRLEEPNGSDTYYALSILHLLGVPFREDRTLGFLKARQQQDGAYESIFQAFYCLQSLKLLGEEPEADPTSYILDHLHVYEIEKLPAEVTSIFRRMLMLVELCTARHIALAPSLRETVIRFVMHFRKEDGGFGAFYATLLETAQALRILDRLGYPLQILGSEAFVSQCADPVCGFVDIPFTTFSFLEHIHAGVVASAYLNRPPPHADACLQFLSACQTLSGGFSRSTQAGIATLEDTCLAVETIDLLRKFELIGWRLCD